MAIEELQDGRYRYSRLLGSGGMGEVYLMQDTRVSRQVAIKVVRAESASPSDSQATTDSARLFEREAKAIAALEHSNILPLYDFGEEKRDGIAVTYMVMPYCPDGSLEGWLRQHPGRIFPPQIVAYLVEQAAEALQYAHDHQVIHLDVKPSNFLLRNNRKDADRPTLLLADFGIARNFTTVASSSRTIRGTPTSMAPEQWSSSPVMASDQYALAVMAYEMLVGRPPFTGSMEQLMYQHLTVSPPASRQFNPHLPAPLDTVLLRALAKKPEERFPSIADFASAFALAASQPAPDPEQSGEDDTTHYATLTISQSEADVGLSRLLTLTGGQEMTVTIAPGVRDGQIIRVPHPDQSSGQEKAVFVNIAVQSREAQHSSRETPHPAKEVLHTKQESQTPPINLLPVSLTDEHNLPTLATSRPEVRITEAPRPIPAKEPARRFGLIAFVALLVVLVLVAGTAYFAFGRQTGNTGQQRTPTAVATATPTPTPTPQPGLYIAGTYNGTMQDQTTGQRQAISVKITQTQGQGALGGSVTFNSSQSYPLNGTIDQQGNYGFTVQQAVGQTPLYLHGKVKQQADGTFLQGTYCNTSTASCSTDTGFFTVGPRY